MEAVAAVSCAPRRRLRIGSCTCCRATTHSSTCSWLSSDRRSRRPSRSTRTSRCFIVLPVITATSPGCSPAEWIAPNASTTRFSLSAHGRVSASAVRRESADFEGSLGSCHRPTPPSLPRPNRVHRWRDLSPRRSPVVWPPWKQGPARSRVRVGWLSPGSSSGASRDFSMTSTPVGASAPAGLPDMIGRFHAATASPVRLMPSRAWLAHARATHVWRT